MHKTNGWLFIISYSFASIIKFIKPSEFLPEEIAKNAFGLVFLGIFLAGHFRRELKNLEPQTGSIELEKLLRKVLLWTLFFLLASSISFNSLWLLLIPVPVVLITAWKRWDLFSWG